MYRFCPIALFLLVLPSMVAGQVPELHSLYVAKLPSNKFLLIDFESNGLNHRFTFKDKGRILYVVSGKDSTMLIQDTLPLSNLRNNILWDGSIGGDRKLISEWYEGLGKRQIQLVDPITQEQIKLFQADRVQGTFAQILFQSTDTSLILLYQEPGLNHDDPAVMHFYEVASNGDQIRYWKVTLPFSRELTDIYRVRLLGSAMVFALKVYRISPIEKRGGLINYRWLIGINPAGSGEMRLIELDDESVAAGPPLIQTTGKDMWLFRVRATQKTRQKEIEVIRLCADSSKQVRHSIALDSLGIPKNRFTYRPTSKTYLGFYPISIRMKSDIWYVLFENRHIELTGRKGNQPMYSFSMGPMIVLALDTHNMEMRGTSLEKYQFSHNDDAIYSGTFIYGSEHAGDTFLFNTRVLRIAGIPFTRPVYRRASLIQCSPEMGSSEANCIQIPRDALKYGVLWKYAVEMDGRVFVPMRKGKHIRIGVLESVPKP